MKKLLLLLSLFISTLNTFALDVSYKYENQNFFYNKKFIFTDNNFVQKKDKFHENYTNKTLLLKIDLKNTNFFNNYLWVDVLSPGNIIFLDKNKKIIHSFGNKKQDSFFPIIKLKKENDVIYIVRKSNMRFDGNIKVIDEKTLQYMQKYNQTAMLLFLGSLLFLLLFNLGYYFISKMKAFLFYSLFNLFYGGGVLVFGLFFNFYLGNNFFEESQMTNAGLSIVFSLTFLRHYVQLKSYFSKNKIKIYKTLEILFFIVSISHFFVGEDIKPYIAMIIDISVILTLLMLIIIPILVFKKSIVSRFYLASWFSIILGASFLYAFEYLDFASEYYIIRYSLLIGCIFEMIINSFGLAYQTKKIQKEKNKAEFLALNKEKYQKLLRVIIHDLNTPLSVASMWINEISEENCKKIIPKIKKSLEQSNKIIETVTLEEKNNLSISKVLAKDLYKSLKKEFHFLLKSKNIKLILDPELKKENTIFIGNTHIFIVHVLGNLLKNSIKFSNKNSDIIFGFDEKSEDIVFYLKDKGIGMNKEDLTKLNQNFDFSKNNFNEEKGKGLGLSITKSYLKEYNGNLTFESEKGTGTNAFVSIKKHD